MPSDCSRDEFRLRNCYDDDLSWLFVIEPESRRYLSEDYMFCQWSRNAGIKVWMCPWMRLNHTGSYQFGGSLVDLANIGVSATADPNEKLK